MTTELQRVTIELQPNESKQLRSIIECHNYKLFMQLSNSAWRIAINAMRYVLCAMRHAPCALFFCKINRTYTQR